jgi:hypothetical protein
MKKLPLLFLAVSALASGCGDNSSNTAKSTNAVSGGNPLTAPVDYLGAVSKAQQSAVKTVDVAAINHAVQLFQAEHGRNPKDLDELVQSKYLPKIPQAPYGSQIVYDPNTGQAKVVKQ